MHVLGVDLFIHCKKTDVKDRLSLTPCGVEIK